MKQKHKSRLQLFVAVTFMLALLYVYIIAGTLECDRITCGQALISGAIGIMFMLISGITYTYLGEEE
jgi:hypothetical protein